MSNEKWVLPLMIAIFVLLIAIRVGAEVHARNNCDGPVVKNSFEWPVCVSGGK